MALKYMSFFMYYTAFSITLLFYENLEIQILTEWSYTSNIYLHWIRIPQLVQIWKTQ